MNILQMSSNDNALTNKHGIVSQRNKQHLHKNFWNSIWKFVTPHSGIGRIIGTIIKTKSQNRGYYKNYSRCRNLLSEPSQLVIIQINLTTTSSSKREALSRQSCSLYKSASKTLRLFKTKPNIFSLQNTRP